MPIPDFVQTIKEMQHGIKELSVLLGIRRKQDEAEIRVRERILNETKERERHENKRTLEI